MSNIKSISTTRIVSAFVALAVAATMLFAGAALTKAQTKEELQSQINDLLSQIENLQSQLADSEQDGGTGTVASGLAQFEQFDTSLSKGNSSSEVKKLQQFLNAVPGVQLAASGPGSPGNETNYYGSITAAAVTQFQEKYSETVLAPLNLSAGTGYWGPSSIEKANELIANAEAEDTGDGGNGDTTDEDEDTAAGFTGVKVTKADNQPESSLAPGGAARVPFTNFTVEAGDEAVTIDSVVVKRNGLANDDSFDSIVLLDEEGLQVGDSESLNSDHQARLREDLMVEAGESKTFTIAANMAESVTSSSGNVAQFALVEVNTDASLDADLPIVGASQTVNSGLEDSIGSAEVDEGSRNPSGDINKQIGTTDYTFAAADIENTGDEDLNFKSIRWEQNGSASNSDLDNVVVTVEGEEYETTVSGDYYTASFEGGITIDDGDSVEVAIKGDIIDGVGSKIDFEIDELSDINLTGMDYGYGILPIDDDGDVESEVNTPEITIKTGSVTFSSTNVVPAGDVVNGGDKVSLASFGVSTAGEPISWDSITVSFSSSVGGDLYDTSSAKYIKNVRLVDGNGSTLAGPEDLNDQDEAVMDDTVTLDVGAHDLIVKADLSDGWADGDTITATLHHNSSIEDFEGVNSGEDIDSSEYNSGMTDGKTQTISAGSLNASLSANFVNQNVIKGSTDVVLAKINLDASGSGEDIDVDAIEITEVGGASVDDLSNMKLRTADGKLLTTGGNIENPSSAPITFFLDDPGYTVAKGTTATIELVASINDNASGDYEFQLASKGEWSVEGVETGQDEDELLTVDEDSNSATMSIVDYGSMAVSVDSSDPSQAWYVSGDNATVGTLEFAATNEDMELTDLGIELKNGGASDVTNISLESSDGELESKTITSSIVNFDNLGDFTVEDADDRNLDVKATFADIGVKSSGQSGNLIQISTTTDKSNNKARGVASGATSYLEGEVGTTKGARYFNSLPTVTVNEPAGSWNKNDTEIYNFTVTADEADDVALYKVTVEVDVNGTNATATNFKLFDGNDDLVATSTDTKVVNEAQNVVFTVNNDSVDYGDDKVVVSEGESEDLYVKADIKDGNSDDNDDITTDLVGDNSYDTNSPTDASSVSGNFVWSPLSRSTYGIGDNDWFNGYKVPGMASDNDTASQELEE